MQQIAQGDGQHGAQQGRSKPRSSYKRRLRTDTSFVISVAEVAIPHINGEMRGKASEVIMSGRLRHSESPYISMREGCKFDVIPRTRGHIGTTYWHVTQHVQHVCSPIYTNQTRRDLSYPSCFGMIWHIGVVLTCIVTMYLLVRKLISPRTEAPPISSTIISFSWSTGTGYLPCV